MAETDGLRPAPEYWKAFSELIARVQAALGDYDGPPVPIYIAGGAAAHLYTGGRLSGDVDASIGVRRFVLPDNLQVAYRDARGDTRLLYWDRQYNETLGLMHEDAHAESRPVRVPGVDPRKLDVRVLRPLDLAVSKLSRFGPQDQADIRALAAAGLIDSRALRERAEDALVGYIGRVNDVRISIDQACRMIDDEIIRPGSASSRPS